MIFPPLPASVPPTRLSLSGVERSRFAAEKASGRSVNWVTLRRRYDDPTSPAHAGRAPAAQLLHWNHSIVPPARSRICPALSSLAGSARSRGDSALPAVSHPGKETGMVQL